MTPPSHGHSSQHRHVLTVSLMPAGTSRVLFSLSPQYLTPVTTQNIFPDSMNNQPNE